MFPNPSPKSRSYSSKSSGSLRSVYRYIGTVGSTIGCDFVGTVEQIGGGSSPSDRIKTGDRIVGIVHGGKYKGYGSAAEYLVVEKELCWGVPSGMEPSEAVTFGVGFVTAAFVCLVVSPYAVK
jgi:NADPH:quinone reductase-like Zn-dependent oxidoreductase